ncbi:hypothetical protein COO60DRAFT_62529 [Scenedesmus sp. NREL 46B-D3]|nr:hypothetical protein COO60DRAFT_62529 [Scenedesmus sp. NREL 46B-D3]
MASLHKQRCCALPVLLLQPTRLLAVVIAKNTVGGNWRKTLGTREWSRVPEEEKAAVRNAALQLMLSDPSDRVALQLGLLASNICAFDFPSRWPDVLSNLLAAADWGSAFGAPFKLRALRSLKHIFRGLLTKRFVAEPLPQQQQQQQPGGRPRQRLARPA